MTPLKNALSWFALGAVAVVAACAQGSSATGENEAPVTGDAGVQPLDSNGEDGGSVNQGDNDAGGNGNVSDDAGDPATSDDAGIPSTSDDAGQAPSGDDAGAGAVDAGGSTVLDAGTHSGGTDAGSPSSSVPTTCTQAYGKIGCCANNTAYYCNGTTTPTAKACTGTKVCGWDTSASYYDCVAAPGGADPSGTNPIACQ